MLRIVLALLLAVTAAHAQPIPSGGSGLLLLPPVTYVASGAIAPTDVYSTLNGPIGATFTLAAATDTHYHQITNIGPYAATLTITLLTGSTTITLNPNNSWATTYQGTGYSSLQSVGN